jgi:hypothetical protein
LKSRPLCGVYDPDLLIAFCVRTNLLGAPVLKPSSANFLYILTRREGNTITNSDSRSQTSEYIQHVSNSFYTAGKCSSRNYSLYKTGDDTPKTHESCVCQPVQSRLLDLLNPHLDHVLKCSRSDLRNCETTFKILFREWVHVAFIANTYVLFFYHLSGVPWIQVSSFKFR